MIALFPPDRLRMILSPSDLNQEALGALGRTKTNGSRRKAHRTGNVPR